ncbi:TPA: hypothetical protein WLB57_001380 [Neisseria gonorrhoeae]
MHTAVIRHFRAGGNPDLSVSVMIENNGKPDLPDSRLRGNDGRVHF